MTKNTTEADRDTMLDVARTLVEQGGTAVLFIGNPNGQRMIVPLDLLDWMPEHPTDRLRLVLAAAKDAGLARPPWLCFGADSYMQINQLENGDVDPLPSMTDDPTWHGRGTLQERFEAGHPNVTEVVALTMMSEDGKLWLGTAPYVRSKGALGQDVLTFGEVQSYEHDTVDGDVPDALREFYA